MCAAARFAPPLIRPSRPRRNAGVPTSMVLEPGPRPTWTKPPTAVGHAARVRRVDPDGLLVARLAAGDDEALVEVYDRLGPLIHGIARRITGNTAAAEDVTQDVVVGLWADPHRFDPARGTLRGYLGVQAQRRATDHVRAELRRVLREQRSERLQPTRPRSEVDDLLVGDPVREAVRRLPPEQQEVIELAYFAGLSYREVAARL